jgi:hypothetical protein
MDPKALAKLPATVRDLYLHAVANGTHQVFLWAAAVAVLSLVAAIFLKEVPLRSGPAKPDTSATASVENTAAVAAPPVEAL